MQENKSRYFFLNTLVTWVSVSDFIATV